MKNGEVYEIIREHNGNIKGTMFCIIDEKGPIPYTCYAKYLNTDLIGTVSILPIEIFDRFFGRSMLISNIDLKSLKSEYDPIINCWYNDYKYIDNKEYVKMEVKNNNYLKYFKYIPSGSIRNGVFFNVNKKITIVLNTEGDIVKVCKDEVNPEDFAFNNSVLFKYCKFKIKSVEESIKLFGRSNQKRKLINQILSGNSLEFSAKVKNSEQLQDVIVLNTEFGNLKFAMSDVEVIYPRNFNGVSVPKDRTINIGSDVLIKNNRNIKILKRNSTVKVVDLKNIGNKKYVGIKVDNKFYYDKIKNFKKI